MKMPFIHHFAANHREPPTAHPNALFHQIRAPDEANRISEIGPEPCNVPCHDNYLRGGQSRPPKSIVVSKCEKAIASLMKRVRADPENAKQSTAHHAVPYAGKAKLL
jgi:hypothetical protein